MHPLRLSASTLLLPEEEPESSQALHPGAASSMLQLRPPAFPQVLLDTLVRNYSPSLTLSSLSPVLAELPPLVSETDLHIAQVSLYLAS